MEVAPPSTPSSYFLLPASPFMMGASTSPLHIPVLLKPTPHFHPPLSHFTSHFTTSGPLPHLRAGRRSLVPCRNGILTRPQRDLR